jgi:hypothetical protein
VKCTRQFDDYTPEKQKNRIILAPPPLHQFIQIFSHSSDGCQEFTLFLLSRSSNALQLQWFLGPSAGSRMRIRWQSAHARSNNPPHGPDEICRCCVTNGKNVSYFYSLI